MTRAYEEIADFIAGGTSPDSVAAFRPSDAACQRVADLIELKKNAAISDDEADEFSHYLEVEHIIAEKHGGATRENNLA